MLRVLLEEMDPTKFECLLKESMMEWECDSQTTDFYEYFRQYYGKKAKQWAGCYRKEAFINTNMFAESFHRVLKHVVYLKGTVNKRMDTFINVLVRYSRDKAFDRLLKMENSKGKGTKRCSDIIKRHNTSLQLSLDLVSVLQDGIQWQVQSSSKPLVYTIQKNADSDCDGNCWIRCRLCGICVHNYTCSCPDSMLHGTICKHVHLVMRSASKPPVTLNSTSLQPVTNH